MSPETKTKSGINRGQRSGKKSGKLIVTILLIIVVSESIMFIVCEAEDCAICARVEERTGHLKVTPQKLAFNTSRRTGRVADDEKEFPRTLQ